MSANIAVTWPCSKPCCNTPFPKDHVSTFIIFCSDSQDVVSYSSPFSPTREIGLAMYGSKY